MTSESIICFGQQPCGFFPKRFLVAKINTAKKMQSEIGGRIVFFYHDSDADYRETITVMKDRQTGAEVRLNFTQENKLQKKFSPLYCKRVPAGWKEEILKQLPRFITPTLTLPHPSSLKLWRTGRERETAVDLLPLGEGAPMQRGADEGLIDIFKSTDKNLVADFCLEMYRKMGLLEGIEVLRSSDKNFRESAPDLAGEFFADVEYQGEIVRAKIETLTTATTPSANAATPPLQGGEASAFAEASADKPQLFASSAKPRSLSSKSSEEYPRPGGGEVVGILHEGGDKFIRFPINQPIQKSQISAGRDQRFAWMQSVINCTHYIYGEGEKEYLNVSPFPNIKFIDREKIDQPGYAWTEI
jgi:hypothetical protein